MTVKAGQKCTAIRRAMAPAEHLDAVEAALRERLAGDQGRRPARQGQPDGRAGQHSPSATTSAPRSPSWTAAGARIVAGDPDAVAGRRRRRLPGADPAAHRRSVGHRRGPRRRGVRPGVDGHALQDLADAIALANRGMGSLALSLFTHSPDAARDFIHGAAAFHGRMLVINRDQCRGIDRPRLAAPGARPRRPRPRRRQRGDGRRPRRQALHAAHRDPVVAGDDRRDHRAIYPRRAQALRSTPTRSASG